MCKVCSSLVVQKHLNPLAPVEFCLSWMTSSAVSQNRIIEVPDGVKESWLSYTALTIDELVWQSLIYIKVIFLLSLRPFFFFFGHYVHFFSLFCPHIHFLSSQEGLAFTWMEFTDYLWRLLLSRAHDRPPHLPWLQFYARLEYHS